MPTFDNNRKSGIVVRIYYHTNYPYKKLYHDFLIYEPLFQYNQVTADFSTGVLKGITPGGDGIPSTQTGGLTFVQSGLGLMTNIEIPSLFELYKFGSNLTIINMDMEFETLPYSFDEQAPLPLALSIDRLKNDLSVNREGLIDFSSNTVSISQKSSTTSSRQYTFPITRYAWDEQDLISKSDPDHNTLILRATYGGNYLPNINRMVLGDSNNDDCKMKLKMFYTLFE